MLFARGELCPWGSVYCILYRMLYQRDYICVKRDFYASKRPISSRIFFACIHKSAFRVCFFIYGYIFYLNCFKLCIWRWNLFLPPSAILVPKEVITWKETFLFTRIPTSWIENLCCEMWPLATFLKFS